MQRSDWLDFFLNFFGTKLVGVIRQVATKVRYAAHKFLGNSVCPEWTWGRPLRERAVDLPA
jgi:hypothetical protein